jgi:hypothetical protein
MAFISIPPVRIKIDIPDLVVNGISLKRTATLFTMIYNQAVKSLTLAWIVEYTDLQGIKGLSSYTKESIADNTTMVDVNTGAIIKPTQVQDTNQDGTPKVDENGDPVMIYQIVYDGDYIGQYDWFNNLAETQAIGVHDLIRQYGLQADWSI